MIFMCTSQWHCTFIMLCKSPPSMYRTLVKLKFCPHETITLHSLPCLSL